MKKNIVTLLALCLANLFSCGENSEAGSGKMKIIATLFPQYDFARQIAGDKADVVLLLPPGVEAHAFEPTPRDIAEITKADLFIYTGAAMEPWADKIAEATKAGGVLIVDSSRHIEYLHGTEQHDEEGKQHHDAEAEKHVGNERHHHGDVDPHVWTDPANAKIMVDNIMDAIISKDPNNGPLYRANCEAYKLKLDELDRMNKEVFAKVRVKTILYGGHFAFGYFAKRYGLSHLSPYTGFSPDAEPSPQRIAELIRNMKTLGLDTVFFEELIDPKAARVIADQTGAKMQLLHGAHNLSKEERERGDTYLSLMRQNLEKLKSALGYGK